MVEKIKNFFKTLPLNKAHSYFMGSAAIVQFIPIFTAPIIARLYTPEDFGAYAVFFGLVAIISSFAQLAFHNAILLAKSDEEAATANILSILISVMVSLSIFLIVLFIPEFLIINLFGDYVLKLLIWLPLTVLITSLYTCLYTWWIRKGYYKRLGINQLVLGISTALIQITIGFLEFDAIGFVIANLIGNLLALILLVKIVINDMLNIDHQFNIENAKKQLHKRKALILFTTPAGLINSLASYLPDFFINTIFGTNKLGQYSLANRMVNMPLNFFSASIQDIFKEQASKEFNNYGHCMNSFKKYLTMMSIVSFFILIPIILILPYVFPFIFGNQWKEAGFLIQPLIILISLRFISSPLSYVWIIKGHQDLDMYWQIGLIVLTILTFLLTPSNNIITVLWSFSFFVGLWYGLCIYLSFIFSKPKK